MINQTACLLCVLLFTLHFDLAAGQEGEEQNSTNPEESSTLAVPAEQDDNQEATILIPPEVVDLKPKKPSRLKDIMFKSKPVFEELLSKTQRKILDVAEKVFRLKYNSLPVKKTADAESSDSNEAVEVKAFEILSSIVGKVIRNTIVCSTVTSSDSRHGRRCSREGMSILSQAEFQGDYEEEEEQDPLCAPADPDSETDEECQKLPANNEGSKGQKSNSLPPLKSVLMARTTSKPDKVLTLPTNGDLTKAIADQIWDRNGPTKIIFNLLPFEFLRRNGMDKKINEKMAAAFATKYGSADKHNILEIQWPEISTKHLSIVQLAARFLKTARQITRILKRWDKKKQIQLDRTHIIGASMGAHLAGVVGNMLKDSDSSSEGKLVGRITGLDPLGWGFDELDGFGVDPEMELTNDDAKFVDIIHTSAPDSTFPFVHYGSNEKRGTVDFYPNNGRARFCSPTDGLCHHLYSIVLYISSISGKNFVACKCSSWDNLIIRGKCSPCPETARMGEDVDKRQAKGVYFIATA